MFETIRPRPRLGNFGHRRTVAPFVRDRLAAWQMGLPPHVSLPEDGYIPGIIAVGGGKGGVGKSILSSNLSSALARKGHKVLAIDLDLGCSNLHTHFGVEAPKATLADYLARGTKSFDEIIVTTPTTGVAMIASGREEEWRLHLDREQNVLIPLWHDLVWSGHRLGIDFIVIDLGAGTHQHTMSFFTTAHLGITTVLPEPTSIENAYVFLRMALWQTLENVGARLGRQEEVRAVEAKLTEASSGPGGKGYLECLKQLAPVHPELIRGLAYSLQGRAVGLVVNQARNQADMDIGKSMEHICHRFFGFQSRYLGYLNYDEAVWKSLRNRRHLATDFPHSLIVKRVAAVAQQTTSFFFGVHGG